MDDYLLLPKGRGLSLADATATVRAYLTGCPAVIDLYDRVTDGAHDELSAVDLLSVNALNGFCYRAPMDAMTAIWLRRSEFAQVVAPIPKGPLEDFTSDERESAIPLICKALLFIDDVPGFGETATTKLLRQARRDATAIWDSRVGLWYSEFADSYWADWLRQVYADVLRPQNLRILKEIQRPLDFPAPILRLWDIILWQTPFGE